MPLNKRRRKDRTTLQHNLNAVQDPYRATQPGASYQTDRVLFCKATRNANTPIDRNAAALASRAASNLARVERRAETKGDIGAQHLWKVRCDEDRCQPDGLQLAGLSYHRRE